MNVAEILKSVEIVSTCSTDILTVHFLCIEQEHDLNMLGFKEAVDTGVLQVAEVGDGIVSELCFHNTGNQPVFIPDGTIVEGMMQNRFIRVSFIITGKTMLNVPAACVEASRFEYENNRIGKSSPYHMYPSLRAMNCHAVNRSLRLKQGYESHDMQRETWHEIEGRLTNSKTDSRTRYLGDYYRNRKKDIDRLTRGIFVPDDVNGFIALIEGKPIELTIMGSRQLFSDYAQKLMTGIAVECFEDFRNKYRTAKKMTYEQFMDAVSKSSIETYPSIGVGQDMRMESKRIVGAALTNQKLLVHLGVYANI